MDPLSYNLYAYCKNNPTAYTDPSGHWKACVHRNKTYFWAIWAGFTPAQAEIIALGCVSVDSDPETTPISEWDTKLQYHFNRQNYVVGATEDTRKTCSNEFNDIFQNLKDSDPSMALYYLGKSLHPLQDIDAHGNQGIDSFFIAPGHDYLPQGANWEQQDHFDNIAWEPNIIGGEVASFTQDPDGASDRFMNTYNVSFGILSEAASLGVSQDVGLRQEMVDAWTEDNMNWFYDDTKSYDIEEY